MHYLLGLAALVLGAIISTRRTRPSWFVVTTCVLVALGALLAILSYTRVTDPMGLVANSVIGWVFVGLAIITMFSAIFVLERRGEHGEELPPLIGDNPFDGDTDDSDDPTSGTARTATGAAPAAATTVVGVDPDLATPPETTDAAALTDPDYDAWTAAGEPERRTGAEAGEPIAGEPDRGEPGTQRP